MNILIVWQEIPDSCGFIELNVTPDEAKLLCSFHGHYVNGRDEMKSNQILEFFYDNAGTELKFSPSEDILTDVQYDFVITTGFLC